VIIFGVLLTNQSPWVKFTPKKVEIVVGGLMSASLFGGLTLAILRHCWATAPAPKAFSVLSFGRELLTTYLVPFELISVLLLAVMIGSAYLARPEKRSSSTSSSSDQ
ncbi:MAG: NADH-quinone oxidoreductase subunit J, partial [Phycisphaerae bacterium]|nr:NADH-quinone oxidoreductase subunit J [Phycisphaerae bacterium]